MIFIIHCLVNGTAQSTQPITTLTNQSAAAVAACAAAAATGCPGTPSPVTHQTEPLSATAAAVFAATGIHPAAYAGSHSPDGKDVRPEPRRSSHGEAAEVVVALSRFQKACVHGC